MPRLRVASALALISLSTQAGCAYMGNLDTNTVAAQRHVEDESSLRRATCQSFVDVSASFVGTQQGWGIVFGVVAAGTAVAGAAVTNADDGNAWEENRKTILLTTAVPAALLSYNFFNNASSATKSLSSASVALANPDDDEMWAGCQQARAEYWDGRTAGIQASAASVGKAQETQKTAKAEEEAKTLGIAERAAERAKYSARTAKAELDEAAAKKPPASPAAVATLGHYTLAQAAVGNAKTEADKAQKAAADAKDAAENGDTDGATTQRNAAEAAAKAAEAALKTMRDELKLY